MKKLYKRRYFVPVVLFLIVCLGVFLRFYKLDSIPPGLYQDETAIGYNAYSILQTGKDEYGKAFPLYFKSFGDQKLPVYIYTTALSIKAFGFTPFAVRFPSALFGSLEVALLFFIVRSMSKNLQLALLSALFLAVNPWNLHFSRAAFEVNGALFFCLVGVLAFLQGIKGRYTTAFFIISVSAFALSLYSYNVTRLLSPLLVLALVFFYRNELKKTSKMSIVSTIIVGIVLLLPFLITFFSSAGAISAKGAVITSADIQAKGIELRSYLLPLPSFVRVMLLNKFVWMGWEYLQNLVQIFSPAFFFIEGTSQGTQGIGLGMFYLFEFPLMLIGLISVIKNKLPALRFFTWWAICAVLVLALSKEVPHATRGYFLVIPLTLFSAYGLYQVLHYLIKIKNTIMKDSLIALAVVVISYNLFYYFSTYYFKFPVVYASEWRSADKDLSLYLQKNQQQYKKIVFDSDAGFIYTSLLFYLPVSPVQFQTTVKRAPDDSEGFSAVESFGKYEFRPISWEKDTKLPNTLIITSANKKPSNLPVFKTFYYPTRYVVLSVKENIVQYPVDDVAYVLFKTK